MSGEGAVGTGTRQLTSVEVCRLMAAEIWRSERPHEHLSVHGLNSERAVRERLQKIAMELEAAPDIDDVVALGLLAINWSTDDPLSIMEKTENMLIVHRGETYSTPDRLLSGSGTSTIHLMRLSIVQSLAGRLGRWAVRSGEIPDARTARTLYKDLGEAHWSQYRALLVASEELFKAGRHRDSAISLLDADRLVRTPAGLLQASIALTKAGDYISALWAIRAALLEPKATFESADAHLKAHKIEGRLRAVIEGRAEVPLAMDEAQLLVGDTEVPPERREDVAAGAKVIVTAASAAAAAGPKITISRNASRGPNAPAVTASARPPAGSAASEQTTIPGGPGSRSALELTTIPGGPSSAALIHARIDDPRKVQSAVGRTLLTKRAVLTMRVPAASERISAPVKASSIQSGAARVPALAHLLPPSMLVPPDPHAARTVIETHPQRSQSHSPSHTPSHSPSQTQETLREQPRPRSSAVAFALSVGPGIDEPADLPLTHSDEVLFAPVQHPNLPPGDESTQVPAARVDDLVIPERAPLRRPRSDRFRANTAPPNADHRALLRAEREASTEDVHALPLLAAALEAVEGEESTQIPLRPASDPFAMKTVRTALESSGPPIAHRSNTLPPNTQHRQLLRAEQYRHAPATREIDVAEAGESPWEAMISETAAPQLVSDAFDIDVVWDDGSGDLDPISTAVASSSTSTEQGWEAVVVHDDAIVSIVPEPEDLPTDMIEPIHLVEVLRRPKRNFGNAAHEVTERIRDRNPAR